MLHATTGDGRTHAGSGANPVETVTVDRRLARRVSAAPVHEREPPGAFPMRQCQSLAGKQAFWTRVIVPAPNVVGSVPRRTT